ncbi:MAG TPA: hypothetical protein VK618_11765 [Flavitalea sp.]|nr:hypothetical protein [Flavitalea sp.]
MLQRIILTLCVVFLLTITKTVRAQHKLVEKWRTDTILKVPESVFFDAKNKILYVSNIDGAPDKKDGKGSIGKIGLDGKVINVDWVRGLNAPKGMALVNNTLWVADLSEVVGIDIVTGQITKRIAIPNSEFLNDVAADANGVIYVSDSKKKTVIKIENDKPSFLLENLKGPNGLLVHNKQLYVLDDGSLNKVGADKTLTKIADGMEGNTDGLQHVQGADFLVSCWAGFIYYVKGDGTTELLLDTHTEKSNTADISYDPSTKTVFVPTFFKKSVVAYQLQ